MGVTQTITLYSLASTVPILSQSQSSLKKIQSFKYLLKVKASLTGNPCKIKIRSPTPNIQWHRLHITIPKRRKKSIVREDWIKKQNQKPSKLQIMHLHVWCQNALQLPSASLTITRLSLGLVHTLLAALLGRCPTTLASSIFWGLQHTPGFTFTASHNGLSGPLCRDTPDLCLVSVSILP